MDDMSLIVPDQQLTFDALRRAISTWAHTTTSTDSMRRHDLLRCKNVVVNDFFESVGWLHPRDVLPDDILVWQEQLKARGLQDTTIYSYICRVSSFYKWAIEERLLERNPVNMVRPKAPKQYQTESAKSLTNEEVRALLAVVKERADDGSVVAMRDYAMLLFYLLTGLRRAEVLGLRWGDVQEHDGYLLITCRIKGGTIETRKLHEQAASNALTHYLHFSGRLPTMQANTPLWTSHDRANIKPGGALCGHAFVANLKKYAREAGIGDIHLHQTRHTVARIVAERGGITAASEQLGHKNLNTTRVYVQRVGIRQDRYSHDLADEFGVS